MLRITSLSVTSAPWWKEYDPIFTASMVLFASRKLFNVSASKSGYVCVRACVFACARVRSHCHFGCCAAAGRLASLIQVENLNEIQFSGKRGSIANIKALRALKVVAIFRRTV